MVEELSDMQAHFIKNGDPKNTDKPSTFILVKKGDPRTIKFKNFESNGKIKLELTSHQELGFKLGPVVEGVDQMAKHGGSIEKV